MIVPKTAMRAAGFGACVALLVAAGGIANAGTAKIPDKNDKIKLCYNEKAAEGRNGGAGLRIYDPKKNDKKCKSGDDKITLDTEADSIAVPANGPAAAQPSGQVQMTGTAFGVPPKPFAVANDVPGLAINLPSAGTYMISADIRSQIQTLTANSDCFVIVQLATGATSVAVPASLRMVNYLRLSSVGSEDEFQVTTPVQDLLTVAEPTLVKVQVADSGGAGCSNGDNLLNDDNGLTTLNYVKISG